MRTTTAADLAYGLKYALECGTFAQPDRLRLQHLLTRWDARQRQPNPGAAIIRQWTTDRDHFLGTLAQLDEVAIYQMAEAVALHCAARVPWAPVTTDQMLAAWQRAAEAQQCADRGNRGLDHGSSTTMRA